jgi:uncharacterized protein YcfJ
MIGLAAGRLKDASGAATAAGLRPVLDPPGRSPPNGSYRETGDASHARPATTAKPLKPSLTRLRSFRDDNGSHQMSGHESREDSSGLSGAVIGGIIGGVVGAVVGAVIGRIIGGSDDDG